MTEAIIFIKWISKEKILKVTVVISFMPFLSYAKKHGILWGEKVVYFYRGLGAAHSK